MVKSLLGSIFRKQPIAGPGDLGAAVEHFRAGRLNEASALAHGDESAAARYFEDAVAASLRDAGFITNLAETMRRSGDLDTSEELSHRALEIDPARVPALHTLALTFTAQGRGAEALECYQKLLSLDPDFVRGRDGYLFLLQLTDRGQFMRNLERTYRAIWREWCARSM